MGTVVKWDGVNSEARLRRSDVGILISLDEKCRARVKAEKKGDWCG